MTYRRLGLSVFVIAAIVAAFSVTPASASGGSSILTIDDSQLQAMTTTVGGVAGAPALNTGKTVPHWFDTSLNPHNGVTYGYNMVGSNPNTCTGSSCSAIIQADITPLVVNVGGRAFSGNDGLAATLASPQLPLTYSASSPAAALTAR